jgi:hypothetical protein
VKVVIVACRPQIVVVKDTVVQNPPALSLLEYLSFKCLDRNLWEFWADSELAAAISTPITKAQLKNQSNAWVY